MGLEWQALRIKLFKVLLFPAYSSPLLPLDLYNRVVIEARCLLKPDTCCLIAKRLQVAAIERVVWQVGERAHSSGCSWCMWPRVETVAWKKGVNSEVGGVQ